jgi:Tfp pilus assembly protein PilV
MILTIEYAWRHWKLIAGGLALATMGLLLVLAKADARHWQKQAEQTQAAFDTTAASYRLAAEKARADDLAHAREVEARDAETAKENERAYSTQLADARAALARYVSLHQPSAADPGRSGTAGLPGTAVSTVVPDRAGSEALVAVADLDVCAVNTTRLEQVRAWWAETIAAPR